MRYFFVFFVFFLNSVSFSQLIDYDQFSSDLSNEALIKQFNGYRRSINMDTLVYSEELFQTLSKPNCIEVANSGGFYHPNISYLWSHSDIKPRIAIESMNKIGGIPRFNGDGSFWMDTHENAFRTTKRFTTYEELADFAIYSWSISTKGHREVQMMPFMTMGLPGMFSCHSELNPQNGYTYIFINFVMIRRI